MTHLAKFQLQDGKWITAEVGDDAPVRTMRGGVIGANDVIAEAGQTFDSAMASVKHAAEAVIAQLSALAHAPDEIDVDFGVKLSAQAGAVITKASAEANFQISLKWKKA